MKIGADRLAVRYRGSSAPALSDVSFTVEDGSLVAVIGPNGSGKSTLMRALLGVAPRVSGTASVDGRPVGDWKRSELARRVGAVAQSEAIAFPLTVRELVAMGRYPHSGPLSSENETDRAAIRQALESCDLVGLADRDVTTLSGGEFQLARIARALAQEPSALVLDEPTASLDVSHQMEILELLRRSADNGLAVLLVTHDLDLAAQFADRMILLSRGSVVASGTPGEVLREEILSEVYGWPISVRVDPETGIPRIQPQRRVD